MLEELRQNLADGLRPVSRSVQFWARATDIYTGYKVCQLRTSFVKDAEEREAMWERQHELAADKMDVLVMEFIEGTPIMNLGNEMAKRGINPGGKIASMALWQSSKPSFQEKILQNLTSAYGQMILRDGFFHADPHPGNILICKEYEATYL